MHFYSRFYLRFFFVQIFVYAICHVYVSQQNGEHVVCIHIGEGLLVPKTMHKAVVKAFGKAWPWAYGHHAPNSKDPRSATHRRAYDLLVAAIWPAGTETKFFGLEGFPSRPPFHTERARISLGWLEEMWGRIVRKGKFPKEKVSAFLIGRVWSPI